MRKSIERPMIYDATIKAIHPSDKENFCVVTVGRKKFNAYEPFFDVKPGSMLGKSVALIADSRNNLLSVLYEGRWLYHHNEELFYALTEDEQSEANLSHARRIVSDPITEKYIQRYIHRSENIDHEAARIVADEKKQKRYKNMIKNIDPHITCYLKLDSLPELLDAKHMAAIILGYRFTKAFWQMIHSQSYLEFRYKKGHSMEENERILRDEYSHYITTVKEYIQAPHTFEQFAYEMYLATKNRIVKKDS